MTTACPSCGASNPDGSPWCNQCFKALGTPPAPAAAPTGEAQSSHESADSVPPSVTTEAVEVAPGDDGLGADADAPTWQCRVCDETNPLSSNVCSICQTPIFVTFGAETEEEPALSPNEAVGQALVPGLAHIRMGHGLIGFTIALLVWVLIIFALIIASAGGAALPVLLVFAIAIGILLVSVYDAQQIARRRSKDIVLKPRILTFVALGAIAIVIAIIWVQGLSGAASTG